MWVQDCCKNGIPIDSNMVWERVKSLHDNLKQKEDEESKAENWIIAKDGVW